jgi:hypothetical protein
MRTRSVSPLLALLLLAVTATGVAAAAPLNMHIEVPELIGVNGDPFTASGAAVSAGVLCPSGTVDDLSVTASGSGGGTYTILHAHKRFYCSDASGTFDVKMVVRLDNTTLDTTATWRIIGGTGAYVGLRGSGSLAGTSVVPHVSVDDVYDGRVY